tara:strand:- start:197 stop:1324 length:1128 start_codon:yes stop_codon:yes gene_type:complete
MKISQKQIKDALSEIKIPSGDQSIYESGIVKNIQIFGTEIILDLEINNPTLQYKKRIEVDCLKIIHEKVYQKAIVKVVFSNKEKEPQKNIIKGNEIPGVKNIIAISSGKGGVGKSTITANLAVALSDFGYKVGVVDADIYGPSMHIMFDLEGSVPETINIEGKSKINPLENYGVKILSIGFFAQSNQAVVWRGPMATKALNQLIWETHWGELDYLLIDLPPGTGDIHLSLVQSVPVTGAVVVTTPQAIALADAKKGVNMFQLESINVPVLGIVENMSYFVPEELPNNKYYIFGKEGSKILSEQMNIDLLGEIPLVQSLREASDIGRPAVLQRSTEIAISLSSLAKKVIEKIEKRNLELSKTQVVKTTNTAGCSEK